MLPKNVPSVSPSWSGVINVPRVRSRFTLRAKPGSRGLTNVPNANEVTPLEKFR